MTSMLRRQSNYIASLLRHLTHGPGTATNSLWDDRVAMYNLWDLYYHNTVYEKLTDGGQRDKINDALGRDTSADLAGLYNPVSRVVDFYQHIFRGSFGDEITLDPQRSQLNLIQAPQGQTAPLTQLWRWSNIEQQKQVLQRLAPLHGTSGIRIVAQNAPLKDDRRVYLKMEHARVIRDMELNARGHVQAIVLQYEQATGIDDKRTIETIREEQDKQEIRLYTVDDAGELRLKARYPNALGLISYVPVWFIPTGTEWGLNAFYRVRGPLDRLNKLLVHIDTQIGDHINVVWLIAAAGQAPKSMDLSGRQVMYVNTQDGNSVSADPLVAPLNLADAINRAKQQLEIIQKELPELYATDGEFLANQSGDTIAQLRQPAEDKLALARFNVEDALIRAQQIALSWMIMFDLFDAGTGTGTREAADRAYRTGLLDHQFNKRELLPLTEQEKMNRAQQQENLARTQEARQRDAQPVDAAVQARLQAALEGATT